MSKAKETKKATLSRQIKGRPKFRSKNIKIREDQHKFLNSIVATKGGSVNEIIRRMIDDAMTASTAVPAN